MVKNLNDVLKCVADAKSKTISVANAADKEVIEALHAARENNLIEAILVGDETKIRKIANDVGLNLEGWRIIDLKDEVEICEAAVKEVSEGRAEALMKGMVATSSILRAALNKEWGLRTGNLLSHTMVMEIPTYDKLLLLTDGAMNLNPTIEDRVMLIQNAVKVANKIGVEVPKVAALSAVEKVNPKMQSSVDGKELEELSKAGKIPGCVVSGPLAMDLAISKSACEHKGYEGSVCGDADILLAPNIEMANGIYKTIVNLMPAKTAGVVMGAKCPIVLTSRSDSAEAKLYSMALAMIIS